MWAKDNQGSHIPISVKRRVSARQHHRCAGYDPSVCTVAIDDYDHVLNLKALHIERSDPRAKDPANIQGLCHRCHQAKTQAEARAGAFRRSKRAPLPPAGLVREA